MLLTGVTAMFAGAISMAAGSYLSSSAEKEIFDEELREAEKLAEREPFLAAKSLLLSGFHFFLIAVDAALLGYLIGLAVQYFFPGIAVPLG